MLRSSEIKPLFVDLSLCDKSFSFLCIPHSRYLHAAHTAIFSRYYYRRVVVYKSLFSMCFFSPVVTYKYNFGRDSLSNTLHHRPHPYSSILIHF